MTMDTSRDIIYRGFKLNDETIQDNMTDGGGLGDGISGSMVGSVDMSDIDVVQFIEKRSQQDGMDPGQVFLGARRVRMSGTLYSLSRGLLFDDLADMRAALNPVLAQRDEPLNYGYQPLYFSWATNRQDDYPAGAIDLQVKAMPRAFSTVGEHNLMGGSDADPLAIPWQATFICADPAILSAVPLDVTIRASGTTSGTINNRGNYLTPVDALIVVNSSAGSLAVTVGDSIFTITIPASTGDRIVRFKGADKALTLEENSTEVMRMDLIDFSGDTTWPLVDPGSSAYSWAHSGVTIRAGSHFWLYERYA